VVQLVVHSDFNCKSPNLISGCAIVGDDRPMMLLSKVTGRFLQIEYLNPGRRHVSHEAVRCVGRPSSVFGSIKAAHRVERRFGKKNLGPWGRLRVGHDQRQPRSTPLGLRRRIAHAQLPAVLVRNCFGLFGVKSDCAYPIGWPVCGAA
jgi:hypothetical protein